MFGFKVKKKDLKKDYRLINLEEFNKEQQLKIQQVVLAEKRRIAWNLLSDRQKKQMLQILRERRIKDGKK